MQRDVGIVLSGGGAFAAYEAGVLRAILAGETEATGYSKVDPGIITGTSAGAINAALMISRLDAGVMDALDYLDRVWLDELAARSPFGHNGVFRFRMDPVSFLNPESLVSHPLDSLMSLANDGAALARTAMRRGSNFLLSTGRIGSRALGMMDMAALIAADALPVTLRRVVDLKALQTSERVIQVAAANWTTGSIELFGNKDLAGEHGYEALRASAAIPGIFQPITIGDQVYMDGGLIMNTPLKPAIDAGASTLHVIFVDPLVRNMPSSRLSSTMDIFQRAMAISFAATTNRDIETAARINQTLRHRAGGEKKSAAVLAKSAAARAKRKPSGVEVRVRPTSAQRPLTIHRYNPVHDLGNGLGILDFNRESIKALIERGFQDGIRHDCATSGCVIPESGAAESPALIAPTP
jgi:NTE family protein